MLRPLQLPLHTLTQLQRFEATSLKLHLTHQDSSSSDSALSRTVVSLPSLQHLKLNRVDLVSISCFLACTQAPHLTSLALVNVAIADPNEPFGLAWQPLEDALPGVLQQLPRLAVLQLGMSVTDAAQQQMGHLQGLRQLTLPPKDDAHVFDLQHLPSSITQLTVEGELWCEPCSGSLQQLPQQLSRLLNLTVRFCDVLPAALGSVTQLQRLCLYCCPLLPYDTEGTTALLDVLPKLKSLQELKLHHANLDTVSIAPQRFSALTASSHLTRLEVVGKCNAPIPQAAVQHMFPAGRQAPQLQQLVIKPSRDGCCLDSAGLAAIICTCPGLQHLDIADAVQPSADVSALLQLPQSCTYLSVGGEAFGDAAVPMIAQLTQLKVLSWSPRQLTAAGKEQLKAISVDMLYCFY